VDVMTSGEITIKSVIEIPGAKVTVLSDVGAVLITAPGADIECLERTRELLEYAIQSYGPEKDDRLDFILQSAGPDLNIGFEDMDLLLFSDDLTFEDLTNSQRSQRIRTLRNSILEAEYRADQVAFRLKQLREELDHARKLVDLIDG